jgi:hypothetical protein
LRSVQTNVRAYLKEQSGHSDACCSSLLAAQKVEVGRLRSKTNPDKSVRLYLKKITQTNKQLGHGSRVRALA